MKLAILLLLLNGAVPQSPSDFQIDVKTVDEEVTCTIHARHARVVDLLTDLCAKTARSLEGVDSIGTVPEIDVDLVDRPIAVVVDAMAGAAGLRAHVKSSAIRIEADLDENATAEQLEAMAEVAYLRALRRFPEGEPAAQAKMRLGETQERRKNDGAARAHYESLVRARPESPLAAEALWRLGAIHERAGEFGDAAVRYSQLANLPGPNPYSLKSRIALARSLANKGDGMQALALVDAIDRANPSVTKEDHAERLFVRVAALVSIGRGAEALDELDAAMRLGMAIASNPELRLLRARALSRAGLDGDASRVWLEIAERGEGASKHTAFVEAARSALAGKDALGVLFIERAAIGSGAEDEIAEISASARHMLGLPATTEPGMEQRITRAEEECASGTYAEALDTIGPAWRRRANLGESDVVRAAIVQARATDADRGIDPAIEILRVALSTVTEPEHRKRIYLLAGELYEHHLLWELAAEAYGGRL
jgi:tetratricopeptide (TPR) repeat protein